MGIVRTARLVVAWALVALFAGGVIAWAIDEPRDFLLETVKAVICVTIFLWVVNTLTRKRARNGR